MDSPSVATRLRGARLGVRAFSIRDHERSPPGTLAPTTRRGNPPRAPSPSTSPRRSSNSPLPMPSIASSPASAWRVGRLSAASTTVCSSARSSKRRSAHRRARHPCFEDSMMGETARPASAARSAVERPHMDVRAGSGAWTAQLGHKPTSKPNTRMQPHRLAEAEHKSVSRKWKNQKPGHQPNHTISACRRSPYTRGLASPPPRYRSLGSRPVCLAMRESICGPISSPSWNAKT